MPNLQLSIPCESAVDLNRLSTELRARFGVSLHGATGSYWWGTEMRVTWVHADNRLNIIVSGHSAAQVDWIQAEADKIAVAALGDRGGAVTGPPRLKLLGEPGGVALYAFHCPGCNLDHNLLTGWPEGAKGWTFNGSLSCPTFRPCVQNPGCNVWVEYGQLRYMLCDHALSGSTVELPVW